jgi:hypothetical protein
LSFGPWKLPVLKQKDAPAAIRRVAKIERLNFEGNHEQELGPDLRHRAASFDHLVGAR